ncbi:MAG: Mur ligase family protein, partial [Cyclobacteriaceae bacterium]
KIIDGQLLQMSQDEGIEFLITDSRKILASPRSLFFAIRGVRNNGHDHIASAYDQGVRQFVVEEDIDIKKFPFANFLKSQSSVTALQKLAAHHRSQFRYPVIGITGSNGKTIVKEWLYQMLSSKYKCVKNPGSYNSQIGVPLSVWQMSAQHELGIFEAGISQPGEMEVLHQIIQPTVGLFTMLGSAHDEGFSSNKEKLREKWKLFKNCQTIIYCADQGEINTLLAKESTDGAELIGWGQKPGSNILLKFTNSNIVTISGKFGDHTFHLPFEDSASRENILHCIVLLLHFGYQQPEIQEKVNQLKSVPMRLELKQGINNCQVVDDTYNNDLGGVRIGLEFLESLNMQKKTLILSDVLQSGLTLTELSQQIASLLKEKGIQKFIGVGFGLHSNQKPFESLSIDKKFY